MADALETCLETCLHPEAVERARQRLQGAPLGPLADLFRMLGDPTRAGILLALSSGELCVCDLADLFAVTPGAISHQLRLLKAHRLVRSRRAGKMVFYALDDDHVADLFAQGLDHVMEGRP